MGRNVALPSWSCSLLPLGIRYNATMDEKRYTPRAHLDDSGDRYTNRAVLLSSGQEHCERINFHVLVSLTPGSPTSGAQVPTRKGQRVGGEAAMGEAKSSAGASRPQGSQPVGSVPDHGCPILMPQRKGHWDALPTTSQYSPLKSLLPQLSHARHFFSRR